MSEYLVVRRNHARMCSACICTDAIPERACALVGVCREKGITCVDFESLYPAEFEKLVMGWAETHPERTLKTVLLERFPEARLDSNGRPTLCPASLGLVKEGECFAMGLPCDDCWNRPAPDGY